MRRSSLLSIVITAAAIIAPPAAAQTVEDFYRGKTINFYIGNTVGGGYDLYGRFIAMHLGRYVPGRPNIVPVNMPGAGGLTMAGWLHKSAPRDGTAIAIASQVLPIEQALGTAGVQYDARQLSWIGRAAPVVEVSYTWHTSQTRTLADARAHETMMGGINPTSNTVTYLRLLNSLAGTRFKIITGYPGTTEMHIAMERGEVEGATKTWEAFKADNSDWLRDKKVNMLVQYALTASPELPGVPLMSELGRSENDREVLRFFTSGNELGRSIVAAPDVPKDRLSALRTALLTMLRDPAFLIEARKRKVEIGPMPGQDVQKLVDGILSVSPALIAAAKKAREG
jgi:tripartite-type tricarboxylate transporter receptor subunit TctC